VKPARRNRISVWTTNDEKTTVEEAAALAGCQSVAAFIREVTLIAANAMIEKSTEL
jgi:uncharacterized protein (DUF1778 family)